MVGTSIQGPVCFAGDVMLSAALAAAAAAAQETQMPLFAMHEAALTAAGEYRNPYLELAADWVVTWTRPR
jgi:hypothetical protein